MKPLNRKQELIQLIPNCPLCGTKLEITNATPAGRSAISQAAVIHDIHGLICFGCRRIEIKNRELNKLPWKTRWKKKINNATGIFSRLNGLRKRWNKFVYVNIKGGVLNGKS